MKTRDVVDEVSRRLIEAHTLADADALLDFIDDALLSEDPDTRRAASQASESAQMLLATMQEHDDSD